MSTNVYHSMTTPNPLTKYEREAEKHGQAVVSADDLAEAIGLIAEQAAALAEAAEREKGRAAVRAVADRAQRALDVAAEHLADDEHSETSQAMAPKLAGLAMECRAALRGEP